MCRVAHRLSLSLPKSNFTDLKVNRPSENAYSKIRQQLPGHQEDPNVGMFWQPFFLQESVTSSSETVQMLLVDRRCDTANSEICRCTVKRPKENPPSCNLLNLLPVQYFHQCTSHFLINWGSIFTSFLILLVLCCHIQPVTNPVDRFFSPPMCETSLFISTVNYHRTGLLSPYADN